VCPESLNFVTGQNKGIAGVGVAKGNQAVVRAWITYGICKSLICGFVFTKTARRSTVHEREASVRSEIKRYDRYAIPDGIEETVKGVNCFFQQ
jgi:hypothetical protein